MYRRVISADEVELQAASGKRDLPFPAGAIVTPLARERAADLGLTLTASGHDQELSGGISGIPAPTPAVPDEGMIRRVVVRVLLQYFPSMFSPASVRTITGLVMVKLKENNARLVSGE